MGVSAILRSGGPANGKDVGGGDLLNNLESWSEMCRICVNPDFVLFVKRLWIWRYEHNLNWYMEQNSLDFV